MISELGSYIRKILKSANGPLKWDRGDNTGGSLRFNTENRDAQTFSKKSRTPVFSDEKITVTSDRVKRRESQERVVH